MRPHAAVIGLSPGKIGFGERVGIALSTLGITPAAVPQPFYDAYLAPTGAQAVIAGVRLGVIDALAERAASPAELAERLSLDEDPLELLLGALLTLGYLKRSRDGRFRCRRVAKRWLTRGSWDAVIGELAPSNWATVEHLEGRFRGEPATGWHERGADDPMWGGYQRAMAQLARDSAAPTAQAIPARSPKRLLDLGGSHGLHALAMCAKHKELHASVLDLPAAIESSPGAIAGAAGSERVQFIEGDIFTADLGSDWDLITAHAVLHNFPRERALELLQRIRPALAPGGMLAALELERSPQGQRGTRVGALNSLLFHTFANGRCYRASELVEMFQEAGFEQVRVKRPVRLPANVLVLARTA